MFRVFLRMTLNRRRDEVGGGSGAPHPRAARPGDPRDLGVWAPYFPTSVLRLPFGLCVGVGKIGTLAFVSSNSENIS